VILAITAVEQPDWTEKIFHTHLTREQVRNSPQVNTKRPVSRQQELAMRDYFGWLAYWLDKEMGAASMATGVEYPLHSEEDPHLRSVWDLTGYEVWATDGEMGHLEGFIVDEESWHIGYLDVRGGDWLKSRSVLVPTLWVESVSWANRRIDLPHTREEV